MKYLETILETKIEKLVQSRRRRPEELRRQAVRSLRAERRFLALYRSDGDASQPRRWTKIKAKLGIVWRAEEGCRIGEAATCCGMLWYSLAIFNSMAMI